MDECLFVFNFLHQN